MTPYEEIFAQKWSRVRKALEDDPSVTIHTLAKSPEFAYLKKYLDASSPHYSPPPVLLTQENNTLPPFFPSSPAAQNVPPPVLLTQENNTLPPFFPSSPAAQKAWTFVWTDAPTNISSVPGGAVRVTYPAGKVGSEHGAQFRATCGGALPASHAVLSYDLFVPRDFPGGGTQHGGKLPGFAIGDSSKDSASGGSATSTRAASVRLMWRETTSQTVKIVPYVYFPPGVRQGPGVQKVSHATHMGTDLWRDVGSLYLKKGAWNAIALEVCIPASRGNDRSTLSLNVNGERREVTDACFASGTSIQTVFFSTFFGGGDSYAPPKTTYLDFRRFSVEKKK